MSFTVFSAYFLLFGAPLVAGADGACKANPPNPGGYGTYDSHHPHDYNTVSPHSTYNATSSYTAAPYPTSSSYATPPYPISPTYNVSSTGPYQYNTSIVSNPYGTTSSSTTTPPPSSSTSVSSDEPSLPLTGVTATATESPSSCYSIPTPTASLHEVDLAEVDPRLEGSMLIDNNGQPVYLVLTFEGSQYQIDITDPNQLVVVDPDGNSVIIDQAGLHFAGTGCAIEVDILVDNFFDQLQSLDGSQTPVRRRRRSSIVRRAPQQKFDVQATVQDQCKDPITSLVSLALGSTPCLADTARSQGGNFFWSCDFPGANSKTSQCIDGANLWQSNFSSFLSLINGLAAGALAVPAIRQRVLAAILAATISTEGSAAGVILAVVGLIGVLNVVNLVRDSLNAGDPDRVSKIICDIAKPFLGEFPLPLTLSYSPTGETNVIDSLNDVPATLESAAVTFNDPDSQCGCANPGTCSNYASCSGGSCYCGSDASGEAKCFQDALCNTLALCSTALECGAGQMCLVGSCCGGGVCLESDICTAIEVRDLAGPVSRDGEVLLWAVGHHS